MCLNRNLNKQLWPVSKPFKVLLDEAAETDFEWLWCVQTLYCNTSIPKSAGWFTG